MTELSITNEDKRKIDKFIDEYDESNPTGQLKIINEMITPIVITNNVLTISSYYAYNDAMTTSLWSINCGFKNYKKVGDIAISMRAIASIAKQMPWSTQPSRIDPSCWQSSDYKWLSDSRNFTLFAAHQILIDSTVTVEIKVLGGTDYSLVLLNAQYKQLMQCFYTFAE